MALYIRLDSVARAGPCLATMLGGRDRAAFFLVLATGGRSCPGFIILQAALRRAPWQTSEKYLAGFVSNPVLLAPFAFLPGGGRHSLPTEAAYS